jgi:hypothetical protein
MPQTAATASAADIRSTGGGSKPWSINSGITPKPLKAAKRRASLRAQNAIIVIGFRPGAMALP